MFVSGHTGFKGTWLAHWLKMLGANVYGVSLKPEKHQREFAQSGISQINASYECNICDAKKYQNLITLTKPDVIFHLAAQAIVSESFERPRQTFETNLIGTINTLDAIRQTPSIKSAVLVTTDKVYSNENLGCAFSENEPLGGDDPYSASKACAELAIQSYRKSFFKKSNKIGFLPGIATVRAGNVIGGGDWGKARLVPDLVRASISNNPVELRHPNATRPWQHVLDAINGYTLLAEKLYLNSSEYSGAWNFGPDASEVKSVRWLAERCAQKYGLQIEILEEKSNLFEEKQLLQLNSSKAKRELGWKPHFNTEKAVDFTWEWYEKFLAGENCTELCQAQISTFRRVLASHHKFKGRPN